MTTLRADTETCQAEETSSILLSLAGRLLTDSLAHRQQLTIDEELDMPSRTAQTAAISTFPSSTGERLLRSGGTPSSSPQTC